MRTPKAFSIASIITLFVWYIGSELYLVKKYSIKWVKNLFFIIIAMLAFYICTEVIKESLWGMVVYGLIFVGLSFGFYWALLKKNFSRLK
jgi:hypothetical protein